MHYSYFLMARTIVFQYKNLEKFRKSVFPIENKSKIL